MGDWSNTAAVLADLAVRINAAHARVGISMSEGMRGATEAGRLLLEAKSTAAHGQWLPWLKANCKFSERTAQAYMQVARRMASANEAEAQRVADLSFRAALAAVGQPRTRAKPRKRSPLERIAEVTGHEIDRVVDVLETYLPRDSIMAGHGIVKLEQWKRERQMKR